VAAGHASDTRQAFDRWLGQGLPAFVPRMGVPPEQVIAVVHDAGGLLSLAHPGRTRIDARIPALRDAGLDAIEVYHSDHGVTEIARYGDLARRLNLLASGGSDFHGDPSHGLTPGGATLPAADWERLSAARHRHARR
jgi:predicted metal-dependent phosphoesterase TrpH